ncbi:hypothetical protein B0H14DRAFT_3495884 [Mycena olivaceomarginata]|nr:hypothetical protein B0H14DRAFT_3495884 [Mycena olivaceomarginata]
MANDSPKAVPSAPPPESYPPFPTDPENLDANGAPPPPGTPYMVPYPPPPGMLWAFPPAPQSQSPSTPSSASRPKRRQVKMACTNCAQACKCCDDQRPCLRCQKYGMTDRCVDGQRKERRKGVKRGPYKRRIRDGDSLPASESFTAEVGSGPPAAEWTASHGPSPAPAAAAPSEPAPPAPPASAAAPRPFPAEWHEALSDRLGVDAAMGEFSGRPGVARQKTVERGDGVKEEAQATKRPSIN